MSYPVALRMTESCGWNLSGPRIQRLARAGAFLLRIAVVLAVVVLLARGRALYRAASGWPRGNELLLCGIRGGNPAWVNEALSRGASVNARDDVGISALTCAADYGDEALVRRLIAAGADVSGTSQCGLTALAAAAGLGHVAVMRILLDAGAVVDQPAVFDGTALHYAAALSQAFSVALLLDNGARVDARDREGYTPLMRAVYRGQVAIETIRELLSRGADVNATDAEGQTALMKASLEGHDELVKLLLEAGAFGAITNNATGSP